MKTMKTPNSYLHFDFTNSELVEECNYWSQQNHKVFSSLLLQRYSLSLKILVAELKISEISIYYTSTLDAELYRWRDNTESIAATDRYLKILPQAWGQER
jgi:hypothetical protein